MKRSNLIRYASLLFLPGFIYFTHASVLSAEEMGAVVLEKQKKPPEEYGPGEPFEAAGSYFLGYEFVSQEDSLKAAEYVYPDSSITFGVNLLAAPLPFRYHLDAEFKNKYDYYSDAGFAYKDVLLFRDILVGLHHNLEHFDFLYPGEVPELKYDDRNIGDRYFLDYTSNLLSLRLKTPNFPFHAFLRHRFVQRDGEVEQRYLLGDFERTVKTSQSREIDWHSNALILGLNSHLGPVEIEYAFDHDELDPRGESILYDDYPFSTSFDRPADVYPHNVIAETDSSANSVKIHTSYTGGIVVAGTLANLQKNNNYSQTESDVWKGAVDFSWIPAPVIGLFFKYRHRNVELDTPDYVTLTGLSNTLNYSVRQGISYDKNIFTLSARYHPFAKFTVIPSYEYSLIERDDVDEWQVLNDRASIHTFNLTARAKPLDRLKLKAIYEYRYFEDPAYNTDPDNSNKVRLSATYIPVSWLNVYLDYMLKLTERDQLHYLNNDPRVLLEGGEREGQRDSFLASFSFMFSPEMTVTASWAYNRWDVEQDSAYGKWNTSGGGDLPYFDPAVMYADEANSYSLGVQFLPREDIVLDADLTYTLSQGKYVPGAILTDSSASLLDTSRVDTAETVLSFGIRKEFLEDWEVGFKFYADIYNDEMGDMLDGNLYIGTFTIKRYF